VCRITCALLLACAGSTATVHAWGAQGHRLVALVAAQRLAPETRDAVATILDGRSLADVAVWADEYSFEAAQTLFWHFVNIPAAAGSYDRDRDCPRQPRAAAGSRTDRWRDCAVDRILYASDRLSDRMLDRGDRAVALKFLVHLVGDLHQPLHAVADARGGNETLVTWLGSSTCAYPDGQRYPCNLHGVWDTELLARRALNDAGNLERLQQQIAAGRLASGTASPVEWAMESHALGRRALVPKGSALDESYFRAHAETVDRRLALAGLRLADVINRALSHP